MNQSSVPFDLTNEGAFCDGVLTLDTESVRAKHDRTVLTFLLRDAEEFVQYTDIGCGRLEMKPKGGSADGSDNLLVCRFTMQSVSEIGEFVKVTNHFLKTGELLPVDTADLPVCPKCHRHYLKNMNVCMFCVKKSYVFGRAFGYFKPYLGAVIAAGLVLTLSNIIASLMPLLNSVLIDHYLVPIAGAKPFFSSRVEGIAAMAALMAGAFLVSKVLSIFSSRASNRIGSRFSGDLRLLVYDKIQALSLSSMSGKTGGTLIKRVTKDTEKVKDFFNEQGRYLIEQIIMFTVILFVLFSTNALLTVLVLLPIPIGVAAIRLFWGATRNRYEKQWRIDSKATSILHDIIKGVRVVKSFGNEEREIKKFADVSARLAEVSASNEKFWALVFPLVGNFLTVGEFLVLLVGGRMVLEGTLTLGELTRFNLYLAYLYAPLRWMSTFPKRVADASTSLVKIYEILDEVPLMQPAGKPEALPESGEISFRNVEFGYKSYEPVLKDMSFTIRSGEMVGLVGHSGAGKSTIINLCMRLYDPTLGAVCIGSVDLKTIDPGELRSKIGVVFQETYLFSGTIYDNIAYAKPDADRASVIAAAKAANAHDFIRKLPDGYQTVIGENGHSLSGGERQRISIARAILKNPPILILDEATSSLDPETEIQIQEALSRLTAGRTTIAIAHRLSTLRDADRLFVIEKGQIAESGSHEELMKQDGIYRNLVLAQRETGRLKA